DEVVAVGMPEQVEAVTEALGETSDRNLAHDRSLVEFTRLTVSNPDLASRSIAELNLPVRFGAVATRVRRGDLELLARDDLILEPGDRLAVVVERRQLDAVHTFLGDSDRQAGELDVLSLGLGLMLGVALGLVSLPMPGGGSFALGPAAGPLLVGMVLGALRRTGPVIWALPGSANRTLRQLGLLLFLAGLGLTAGPDVAAVLGSPTAWRATVLSVVIAVLSCVALVIAGRWVLDLSAPRAAGAVAGFLGQPAVLEAANARRADERIEAAYATLFAFSIVVKILLVPVIWNLCRRDARRRGTAMCGATACRRSACGAHVLQGDGLGPCHGAGDLDPGAAVRRFEHRVHHLEHVLAQLAAGPQLRAPHGHVLQTDAAPGLLVAAGHGQGLPALTGQAAHRHLAREMIRIRDRERAL